MIRIKVPLDLDAVLCSGSRAFALATPVRVTELVALAVREVIGARAPQDKFQRSLRATLAGVRSGRYVLDIDGRLISNCDDVLLCDPTACVRFFLPPSAVHRAELATSER
ncbi:MAG: hypothetical protein M3M96_03150 [Candidatus Eremiobacteraeota bacterium]|nr:hypothetical protein [Candidatus Eremiobacteraeota bacterium]